MSTASQIREAMAESARALVPVRAEVERWLALVTQKVCEAILVERDILTFEHGGREVRVFVMEPLSGIHLWVGP